MKMWWSVMSVSFLLAMRYAPSAVPQFQQVLALDPAEGVFAYSRVSPDGRYLVYASERNATRIITLVELATRRVAFTEAGIDAYFSPDGARLIFLSARRERSVSIYHLAKGTISRKVAPVNLGDYYSWGVRDGKHVILTIENNYYYLNGDKGVMPAERVPRCAGMGTGERPLLSKDGRQITTFVRGTLVVRNRSDCLNSFDTGIPGAKADFSWDGRYIAFHSPKPKGSGYNIQVVDLQLRTVRTLTATLPGSSYFPSWTRDGRLSFRYDGPDYRGFMMATEVLSAPASPLPVVPRQLPPQRSWSDIFPETRLPANKLSLVMIWSTWSAHSPDALLSLQRAERYFAREAVDIAVLTATDPGSRGKDVAALRALHDIRLSQVPLASQRLGLTEAVNQIPTTLLFKDGELVDRRLGAQTVESLRAWIDGARLGLR